MARQGARPAMRVQALATAHQLLLAKALALPAPGAPETVPARAKADATPLPALALALVGWTKLLVLVTTQAALPSMPVLAAPRTVPARAEADAIPLLVLALVSWTTLWVLVAPKTVPVPPLAFLPPLGSACRRDGLPCPRTSLCQGPKPSPSPMGRSSQKDAELTRGA